MTLSNFKTYYKATEDNIVLIKEWKNRSEEWNSEPRKRPTKCRQLISTKMQKKFNGKGDTFQQIVLEQMHIQMQRESENIDIDLIPYTHTHTHTQILSGS